MPAPFYPNRRVPVKLDDEPPDKKYGKEVSSLYDFTGMLPWGQWIDDVERAPDLRWPSSISIYDQMRNDSQCQGLYLGATSAILRYIWYIDPNECNPAWVELLAADLNLPVGLDAALEAAEFGPKLGKLRNNGRASWYPHLAIALKAMQYGHYYFEQVGGVTPTAPGGGDAWRLTKLGPRHPRTITEFIVAEDGALLAIVQGIDSAYTTTSGYYQNMPRGQPIPIGHIVGYIWDQEPGNWVGRSVFRSMYRNWLIKDRLLRVDAIKHERNGVGMPIIEGPEGATVGQLQDLDRMAQEYKVGERGGGAVPYGTKLSLVGTTGALPDTIASIRFQNEEMARSMLMMFMQLGQTETGSRALGQSFIDWFSLQQEMIADWVLSIANEHILGDWWAWNVDPDTEQTPMLAYYKPPDEGMPRNSDFTPPTQTEEESEEEVESVAARSRTGDPSPPGGTAVRAEIAPLSRVAMDRLSAAPVVSRMRSKARRVINAARS